MEAKSGRGAKWARVRNLPFDCRRYRSLFLSELPFDSRICDAEALAFGIALTGAARVGAHHGKIAPLADGCVHAGFQQRTLRSLISRFRNSTNAAKQGHAFMTAQHAGGDRLSVKLCEEAERTHACSSQAAGVEKELCPLGLLHPSPGRDLRPMIFFTVDHKTRSQARIEWTN